MLEQARVFVEVSPEMTLFMGPGPLARAPLPPAPIALAYDLDEGALSMELSPCKASLEGDERLILLVQRSAFERIGGAAPDEDCGFHLSSSLRAIVLAIRDGCLMGETLKVYRLGKSIELLCETIRLAGAGELVPLAAEGELSLDDTRRVLQARRLIDERWSEKLTLDAIARACGLNRAKLTRGFRDLFRCSIGEALTEQRLSQASRMLLTTDLPVSSVGYENGYLNNASFARAFARRFGMTPSDFRAGQIAA